MRKVTEKAVLETIEFTDRVKSIKYVPARKKEFVELLATLSEESKWLLTFSCWHCLFNTKFRAVEEDRFVPVKPTEENQVTFSDFLVYLKRHEDLNITQSRELPTMRLLAKCDSAHRSFYKSLITKSFINLLPIIEVQEYLDLDSVTKEQVYGELEYLKTGIGDLSYPISVRLTPEDDVRPCIVIKEASYSSLLTVGLDAKSITKPDWLVRDIKLANTPMFAIGGFISATTFYPTDYFRNSEELGEYFENSDMTHRYEDRADLLNLFIRQNLGISTWAAKCKAIVSEEYLMPTIEAALIEGEPSDYLLVTDSNTTRTGNAYRIPCKLTKGIIEDLWVEDEQAKGFLVSFNGSLIKCSYKFVGKEQSILSTKEVAVGAVISFYVVEFNGTHFIGNSILWKHPRWKPKRLQGKEQWVEKCVLCGSTRVRHSCAGMCASCETNLPYYLKRYGVGVWIKPSAQMITKRKENCWSSDLLNSVEFKFKGMSVVADEEGRWKFERASESGTG